MTDDEWGKCAVILATFYPHNFRVDDEVAMEIWFRMLQDLPGARVAASVAHMVKTQRAFPSVADIRKHADDRPDPTDAWRQACEYVSQWGHGAVYVGGKRHEPPGLPPAISQAVEAMGGVQAVQARKRDDDAAMRAHFFRAYEAAQERELKRETFGVLDGGRQTHGLPAGAERIGLGGR